MIVQFSRRRRLPPLARPVPRPPWSCAAARAAVIVALHEARPEAVVEHADEGLRVRAHGRLGAPWAFVHVGGTGGDYVYRWLVGIRQSEVYRGDGSARRCAVALAAALEGACATCDDMRRIAAEGGAS